MYCSNNCFDQMKTKILHCRSSANNYFYYICVLVVSMLPLSTILIFDFGIVPTVWYLGCFFHFIGTNLYSVSVDQSCIFINKICTNNTCDFQIHFLTEKEWRPYFDICIILVVPISAVILKHKYNPGTKNNNGTKTGV